MAMIINDPGVWGEFKNQMNTGLQGLARQKMKQIQDRYQKAQELQAFQEVLPNNPKAANLLSMLNKSRSPKSMYDLIQLLSQPSQQNTQQQGQDDLGSMFNQFQANPSAALLQANMAGPSSFMQPQQQAQSPIGLPKLPLTQKSSNQKFQQEKQAAWRAKEAQKLQKISNKKTSSYREKMLDWHKEGSLVKFAPDEVQKIINTKDLNRDIKQIFLKQTNGDIVEAKKLAKSFGYEE